MVRRALSFAPVPKSPERVLSTHDGLLVAYEVGVPRPQPLEQLPEQRPIQKVLFRDDIAKDPLTRNLINSNILGLVWFMSSAIFAVLLKQLLQSFPYPLSITTSLLGVQFLSSFIKWYLFKAQRPPLFFKLRRRHWCRLFLAAVAHGMGTIASIFTLRAGPVTTWVLLRLLPYPFVLLSVPALFGTALTITSIVQLSAGLVSNLCFAARSQIRIPTQRFQRRQNVFDVACALSFVFVALPLNLWFESEIILQLALPSRHAMPQIQWTLFILGICYSVSNEMGAMVPQFDLSRRVVMWASAAVVLGEARRLHDCTGAVLVFAGQWCRHQHHLSLENSTKNEILPSSNIQRVRTFSADSFSTQGSIFTTGTSVRSVRSVAYPPQELNPG